MIKRNAQDLRTILKEIMDGK